MPVRIARCRDNNQKIFCLNEYQRKCSVCIHSFTAYCCSVAILCLHEQYQILDILSFLPKWIFFGVMLLIVVPVAIGYVAGMIFSIIGILIVVRNYYYEFFYDKKND